MGLHGNSGHNTTSWEPIRTFITLVIHMRPVSAANKHRMLVKPRKEFGHVHHPKVRMTLYSWFADAECRITLQQL
jgi:hypothetical protein